MSLDELRFVLSVRPKWVLVRFGILAGLMLGGPRRMAKDAAKIALAIAQDATKTFPR